MKTFKIFTVLALVLSNGVGASSAWADYSGEMFEIGSNKGKKLFSVKVQETTEGDRQIMNAVISDPSGKVVLTERTVTQNGQILESDIDQKQLETTAKIAVKEGKVFFTKTKDGKTKDDDEKKQDTFVTTGNFQSFVASRWDELSAGKTVNFRYGVWDRMETVGFEIKKTGEEGEGPAKKVQLLMKPSSLIIATLVNPIEFKFSANTKRLLEMKGRVGPKQNVSGKWKDLDAEVVYSY